GPCKTESVEQPTSDALLIADRIVSAVGPYKLPPTIAPIKVPKVVVPDSDIDSVQVAVDRQPIGSTVSIADIDQLALETSQAARNQLIARAVARRVIKKATVATVKQQTSSNSLTSLGFDAAGVAWEALEKADTRCWGLLPRNIQVLRIEAPAGTHSISIAPEHFGQTGRPTAHEQVTVVDGRNTYIIGWFPDTFTAPRILTSTH
ncbi:MAG: hypothetical protein WCP62_15770, partial [Planctomycetota bacterium]